MWVSPVKEGPTIPLLEMSLKPYSNTVCLCQVYREFSPGGHPYSLGEPSLLSPEPLSHTHPFPAQIYTSGKRLLLPASCSCFWISLASPILIELSFTGHRSTVNQAVPSLAHSFGGGRDFKQHSVTLLGQHTLLSNCVLRLPVFPGHSALSDF